jgi:hypothetical protein
MLRRLAAVIALVLSASVHGQCSQDWQSIGPIFGHHGRVNSTTKWDPDGAGPEPERLVVAGDFRLAGTGPATNVAQWDGENWSPLGTGINGPVNAVAEFGGEVIAGGKFTSAGGVPVTNIARWDGHEWRPLAGGVNPVNALAVYNGDLIAATTGNTVRWNGSQWQPIGGCSGVSALGVYNQKLICAAGYPTWSACIQSWNGSTWQALSITNLDLVQFTKFYSIAEYQGQLVITGDFQCGGIWGVAAWNGSAWTPFGTTGFNYAYVAAINGDLILTGRIAFNGPLTVVRRVANAWEAIAVQPGSFLNTSLAAPGSFRGDLIVAGAFGAWGGADAHSVARWDGAAWNELGRGVDLAPSAIVYSLSSQGGELFAGGSFDTVASVKCNAVARWDGSRWDSLAGGMSASGPVAPIVFALTPYQNGFVAAGAFASAGGVPANNIAMWNGDRWSALGPGIAGTYAAATYRGGLFVGSSQGGANYVLGWDGNQWSPAGGELDGIVYSMAVYNDELYVGGSFTNIGGIVARGIARWNGLVWRDAATTTGGADCLCFVRLQRRTDRGRPVPGCWKPSCQPHRRMERFILAPLGKRTLPRSHRRFIRLRALCSQWRPHRGWEVCCRRQCSCSEYRSLERNCLERAGFGALGQRRHFVPRARRCTRKPRERSLRGRRLHPSRWVSLSIVRNLRVPPRRSAIPTAIVRPLPPSSP